MITNYYENVNNDQLINYFSKLINRLFKIIPMNEEKVTTLDSYVDSLVREILGNSKLFWGEELFLVCGTLKGLEYHNHKKLKSDVFKTIDLIVKIKGRLI